MSAADGSLPRIVRFEGETDAGEYGATTCPHCGADGRYVLRFLCSDGQRRGAMRGCVKRFPVSPIAEEERKIQERRAERERDGRSLASWDTRKLEAIERFYAGEIDEDLCLRTIKAENLRRSEWMRTKRGGRR